MPYKDPEKRKAVKRASAQRARQRAGREANARVSVESDAGVERVLPDPPARDELLRLLGVQARHGSVRAIELLLRMEDANGAGDVERDPLDELARRRAIGA